MKAFVLAAGLGTRLKPWTLEHPKALVPVAGTPMLERVIVSLREQGFDRILVNVHHFADQIVDFLSGRDFGIDVAVSDESELLLDTGGALLHAAGWLCADEQPFLIHNVDILSNADLAGLMKAHAESDADATLLVSDRDSSRRLYFDRGMNLVGWRNFKSEELRPAGFRVEPGLRMYAFSGIHAVSPRMLARMRAEGYKGKFPIMDYYLAKAGASSPIRGMAADGLRLIDIGKPASLAQAESWF
ncbi:MAG: NTP transferase domain-containing protein [Muribaculaceae bacterium]|nr:NTP transferase domain-containing protein [Muribaculaceae bacterium]